MTPYAFTVAVSGQPPSVNRLTELHLIRGTRQRAWSDEFYAYRDMVARLVQQAKPKAWVMPHYRPKEGKGLLIIEIDLQLKRDIDCDNILKPLLDGVKTGLGTHVVEGRKGPRVVPIYDDAGFLPRFVRKVSGVEDPGVFLRIRHA